MKHYIYKTLDPKYKTIPKPLILLVKTNKNNKFNYYR